MLAKVKQMNKNKDFEKISGMNSETKTEDQAQDDTISLKQLDKINKKIIKKNIPKNVPEKKTKTQIAKENEIKNDAQNTLSETLSVIEEANKQESKFDTPEEKRRVAMQKTLLKMKEKNEEMKAKMAAHA